MKYFFVLVACSIFLLPGFLVAQTGELIPDKVETMKARVLEIIKQETKNVPGTDVASHFQTIQVKILDGSEAGKAVTIENDYLNLKKGDVFYLIHTTNSVDGKDYYSVSEPYRLPVVLFLLVLFVILVFVFGGIQGVRGLVSLIGSLVLILYVLLPGILHGFSPVLMSLAVSALIIIVGSYVTHGFNKTTSSAVVGMIVTILFTGLLAYIAVYAGRLTGFSDDEAVYLNFDTRGSIDFVGLLLGGMLIGLLGVLYDVAIGQAISVEELNRIAPHISRKTIYTRAVRIGREHIGALVNTLAIAYVGVSLPLLLLYVNSVDAPIGLTLNREIFATEIIRTMVGSIGLVIAVPITTFISVLILMRNKDNKKPNITAEEIEREKHALEHFEHHH